LCDGVDAADADAYIARTKDQAPTVCLNPGQTFQTLDASPV
jgi:hypothetical protein